LFALRCLITLGVLGTAVSSAPAWAIAPDRGLGMCNVEVWRARDGLPGAWIRAITQTPDGYLWIGTQGGLARYGGGPLTAFAPNSSYEHAGDVMGLSAARDGTVWVTPARGLPLCVRGDAVGACLAAPGPRLNANFRVTDISHDDAGTAWIATSDGLFRVDQNQVVTAIPAEAGWAASAAGPVPLTAIEHDDRGRLWVGTPRGLFQGAQRITEDAVTSIFRAPGGQMWISTDHNLVHVDGDRIEILTGRDGLPDVHITKVIEDHDGNVWIASREGLIRFQPERPLASRFVRFTQADGLPEDDISTVFEDREGSLWVGTRSGGLAQFTDRNLDRQMGPPSVYDQWVSTVAEGSNGVVWAGTNHGLAGLRAGEERTYTTADGLPGDRVHAVLPGPHDTLWIGTDRGLARLSGGAIQAMPQYTGSVTALNFDRNVAVGSDDDLGLWVGGSLGLAHWQHGQMQLFAPPSGLNPADMGDIRCVERDDQGVVWLSINGRLFRLEGNQLVRDPSVAGRAIGKVRAMSRDADGTLWLGTGDGLVRRRQGRWRTFAANEGLPGADLYQVLSDDVGYLWTGAIQGLLRIDKASLDDIDHGRRRLAEVVSFEILNDRREVRANRTRQPGSWKTSSGRMWFATSRGVVNIDPRHLHMNTVAPPVLVERALVDGRPAHRGARNAFPPGSGAFEFQFAAITLVEPRKARHRYMLEGFDADWIDAGTRRAAYYTNMKPGRYRFRVQGSNADGMWNLEGDAVELTLAPHFFQTWWFYALAALLALGIALSFHRLRVDQLRARYVARSAERTRMARELHDSLLQGMAAALMHLRGLRKRFATDGPAASATTIAGEIKAIEELVATNIEETRELVSDLRQDRADGDDDDADAPPDGTDGPPGRGVELGPALEDLVQRVGPFRSGTGDAGPAASVNMIVEGDPVLVPRHVQRELLRITHEALSNALKHAGASRVEVRLSHAANTLGLSVCDDGLGFDPAGVAGVHNGHFGLTGMRERAELLGQFRLDSQPGRGTQVNVTVNLKDLRDA
jgi:ligand-binding sensor domain-containing protein/signal transduction histidine kinase